MIDDVLRLLRDQLNTALHDAAGTASGGAEDLVVLPDGEKLGDAVSFRLGAVSLLLLNLQEEHVLRAADPFVQRAPDGTHLRVPPEIRLNLFVLCVAHFSAYTDSWKQLAQIVTFFQRHRVLNPANTPNLNPEIAQLVVELVTLSFAEQNEIWGSLRTVARPSLLYRIRLLIFRPDGGTALPGVKSTAVTARPTPARA